MPRPVVECVHLSPLRVRLSLSPRGSGRPAGPGPARGWLGRRPIVDHVFNGLVPSLAEVKNVRLK